MRIVYTKIIAILIAGAVFTAGLIMGFGGYVFAGDPVEGMDITIKQNPSGRVSDTIYDSSFSKTKSIEQVRMEVGNVLLGYGFGGEYINQVTEALEGGGVYEAELKSFLLAIGMNEQDTQNILLEFDKLGIGEEGAQGVSTPDAGGAVLPSGISPSKRAEPAPATTPDTGDAARAKVNQELHRPPTLRQNVRENAKVLRDNFRENVKTTIGHVDHGKTGRIAIAHGKGLRMINRYRSAIARFDHILGRLESRIEKIGIEIESEARSKEGNVKETFPPDNLVLLIEEAKNTQTLNKAKLAELEAKYESLLLGKNPGGVAEEARAIAKELKSEIEKLHGILDDIKQATVDYNSSRSNVKL